MEYGSVFGHGAYLGPTTPRITCTGRRSRSRAIPGRDRGAASGRSPTSRPTDTTRTTHLAYTRGSGPGIHGCERHYPDYFGDPTTSSACGRTRSPTRSRSELTAFFSWSAWAAAARRPGHNYSYTNNWPPEELVGNTPTANVMVWSVVSLIALLGGIGLLFGAFGRWNFLGWRGREQATLSFRAPGDVALTPAQRAPPGSSS